MARANNINTEPARKKRRRNFLLSKAAEYTAALQEIGYTITPPEGDSMARVQININEDSNSFSITRNGEPIDVDPPALVTIADIAMSVGANTNDMAEFCGAERELMFGLDGTPLPLFTTREAHLIEHVWRHTSAEGVYVKPDASAE